MHFPVSGVDCPVWLPLAVGFGAALVSVPAGLSGAFLLLPFQMSVLGFVTPAVTPTNLIHNVVSTPGGLYRYIQERRMSWPLALTIGAGTLPGVFAGALIRIRYLPDPRAMRVFAGLVLLFLGIRLLWGVRPSVRRAAAEPATPFPPGAAMTTTLLSLRRVEYEFRGARYAFRPHALAALSLGVGVVGGIYGVGGGAILAPYAISVLGLPAYTIAGATLSGTFLTSVAGICAFAVAGRMFAGVALQPDWPLGALFGLGGLLGGYVGARLQRFLPEFWIKAALGFLISALAADYVASGCL